MPAFARFRRRRPAAISPIAVLLAALVLLGCAAPPAVPEPVETPTVTPEPVQTPRRSVATPEPVQTPTAAPEPVETPTVAPAPAAPEPAPLTLWAVAPNSEERRARLRALLADAAHIAGVELVVSLKSADGLSADVRAAALADLPLPDIVWGSQDDLGILQRAGALRPADDGLAPEDFLPAVIEGSAVDDQRWGTPLGAHGFMLLLYNRKLVDSAPRTADELIVAARRQTGGGRYGIVAGWAEARWFAAWLSGTGGAALDADGAPALDSPQTVAALDLLKELRVSGPPPPSTYEQGARLFRDGRVAFAVDGDWSIERYRQYSETLELGAAPMPRVNATGLPAVGPLGGIYLMYSSGLEGERLEQAYALGRTLARPEFQERIARDIGALPALRAALTRPAVTEDPVLAAAAAQAPDAPGIPPRDELRCAWDAIEIVLPPAILGDLTSAEAAARMQELAAGCVRGGSAR